MSLIILIKNETNITNITDLISDTIYLTEKALTDNVTSNDENDSYFAYGISLIFLALLLGLLVNFVTSSYTVIIIFSMNKRTFI